jgi:hypothetical protein
MTGYAKSGFIPHESGAFGTLDARDFGAQYLEMAGVSVAEMLRMDEFFETHPRMMGGVGAPVGPYSGRDARDLQIVDPVLTQIARQFRPHGFVYNVLFPTISVAALSGQYPVWDSAYWFGDDVDNQITDREETPEIEFQWSTEPYLCRDYGLKISITPRERQQASAGGEALRLEQSKTQFLMTRMATRRERRAAIKLAKVSAGGLGGLTGGGAVAGGVAWATSTAIETDFKTAKMAIYNITGMTPNVCLIPYAKAYDMATNPTLRDIFKYIVNSGAFINLGADDSGEDVFLPRFFQGCRLIIPKGTLVNTAKEGAAKVLTDVWGTSARFLYVDPQAAWGIPSVAYQFQAPVVTGQGTAGSGPLIDRWRQPDPAKDLIRATECIDEHVCAGDLGYELTGL